MTWDRTLHPLDLNYIAGFFDGEGSVVLYAYARKTSSGQRIIYRPKITIVQAERNILERIRSTFGFGGIYKHANDYVWKIEAKADIDYFVRKIRPLSQTTKKQKQLDILAEVLPLFYAKGYGHASPADKAAKENRRKKLLEALRRLRNLSNHKSIYTFSVEELETFLNK